MDSGLHRRSASRVTNQVGAGQGGLFKTTSHPSSSRWTPRAKTAQAPLPVAAVVRVMPRQKGYVLDAESVR